MAASSNNGERKGKRLLVAAIGVATISYVSSQSGCKREPTATTTSGNLVPPPAEAGPATPPQDIGVQSSGNLVPPPALDAGRGEDAAIEVPRPPTGDLVPPPREKKQQ